MPRQVARVVFALPVGAYVASVIGRVTLLKHPRGSLQLLWSFERVGLEMVDSSRYPPEQVSSFFENIRGKGQTEALLDQTIHSSRNLSDVFGWLLPSLWIRSTSLCPILTSSRQNGGATTWDSSLLHVRHILIRHYL